MYNKVECITLSCDNCEEIYQDEHGTGYSIWVAESDAFDAAENDGWYSHGGKHYCPNCHEFDDNDNLIIHGNKHQQ